MSGQEAFAMDEKELLELTRRTAQTLFGPQRKGEGAYALWRQFDPELAKQLSMFYTGRMFAREVLSHKQRELCVVAALTVTSFEDELELHCNAALNVGASAQEVAEVIFQMSLYGGAPCMIQGLKVLRRVLEERGEWKPAGEAGSARDREDGT
jgi:4-carboxymuconolactone decarboxylase